MKDAVAAAIASTLREFRFHYYQDENMDGHTLDDLFIQDDAQGITDGVVNVSHLIDEVTASVLEALKKTPIGMVIKLDDDDITTVTCDSDIPVKLYVEDVAYPNEVSGFWETKQEVLVNPEMVKEYIASRTYVQIKGVPMPLSEWRTMVVECKNNLDLLLDSIKVRWDEEEGIILINKYCDCSREVAYYRLGEGEVWVPPAAFERSIKSISRVFNPEDKEGTIITIEMYVPEQYNPSARPWDLSKGGYALFDYDAHYPEIM